MLVEKIRNDMTIAQNEKNRLDAEVLSIILETLSNAAAAKGSALTEDDERVVLAKDRRMALKFEGKGSAIQKEFGDFMHRRVELLDRYLK